jgi:glucose/arabinose dehydrogenase
LVMRAMPGRLKWRSLANEISHDEAQTSLAGGGGELPNRRSAAGQRISARRRGCKSTGCVCGRCRRRHIAERFLRDGVRDNIGHARHLVVAPNGVVYVNIWSGVYYKNDTPPPGGFLIALKDTKGDGHADVNVRFGETVSTGGHGGTGIGLYKGGLFVEINDHIVRYALPDGEVVPKGKPETIVSGLPLTGDHPMHPFAIDANGDLFVNLGSATNACEEKNRMPQSPGKVPCKELETRGGIWRYDANKTDQHFSPAERFATGLRNGEGISFDASGRIFATQHGRDQLLEDWPQLYKPKQGQNLPAEELVQLERDADYGWPECYFDNDQQKLVLAPEYGGDGGKRVGVCAQKWPPVAFFPAHWAPNDMQIYNGTKFPAAYRGGAFVAFHGSWNRAPGPQGGYNVVFQPLPRPLPVETLRPRAMLYRRKASIRKPATRRLPSRRRPERRRSRLRWATASSAVRSTARRAGGAMDRTPKAPRWGRILRPANGCGVTEAWRPSPRRSPMESRSPKSTSA